MTRQLGDRYRSLLRFYPADYRAERGDEIVDTYLDLARPGQRRPSRADVVDLASGGARQHLRARHAHGLADALPFAATLALSAATALAAVWLVAAETVTIPVGVFWTSAGPFATLGAVAWIVWLLASVAALLGRGRPVVLLALLATVATIPASVLTPYARPPLFVLLPQVALGLLALFLPARRVSYEPAVVGLAAAGIAVLVRTDFFYYNLLDVLALVALGLASAVAVAGVVFTARGDTRGWWPFVLLLGPILLLALTRLSESGPQQWPKFSAAALTAVVSMVVAVAAVPASLWLSGRRRRTRCSECGQRTVG
ncbi:hypothetical protein Ais01nite_07460 [Asanoa ishikariensis]|uniref:Uncharacterized protein n=1 Tax=Asanoa ishikariensis TaxID=137265 RepID=A0A1H3TED6_9ACTN|nr:hypothetical protein [Asanoa ishikariensis]GIF62711.1 hypothetical protein Ais01nite_07460 [Asanoa ishikariensis]SDZ47719.1 hypothetical protein SAMN05421684_5490 [Asanoa ishikariensis]